MSGQPCPECGGDLLAALRYEAAQTVPVRCCWDCGYETPALYQRTITQRNERAWLVTDACRRCGAEMSTARPSLIRLYCSRECNAAANAGARLDRATMTFRRVS